MARTGKKPLAGYTVELVVNGAFSDRGRLDINLINAPWGGGPREPPLLPVSPKSLEALNLHARRTVEEILRELGASVEQPSGQRPSAKPSPAPPAREGSYSLTVAVGGDNGLGGHHGGLDVHLEAMNAARPPVAAGRSFATVAPASGDEGQRKALKDALAPAVLAAFEDLRAGLAEKRRLPVVELRLTFVGTNLSPEQLDEVDKRVGPCAAALAEPEAVSRAPAREREVSFLLKVRVEEPDPEAGARKRLDALRLAVAAEVGNHGKQRCSLFHTPLHGYRAQVKVRAESRELVVSFEKD
jgi:hypothetical protein